jgi:hypothetical protein
MAAPIMRDPPRCAERPNAIVQPAKAGTAMRIDSASSAHAKNKK